MSMSSDDAISKAGTAMAPSRRIEVFTGAGRRREWSADRKAAIVAESYASVGSVCDVARRHGLTPTQLFTWRRADRRRQAAPRSEADPTFIPAVVEAPTRTLARWQDRRRSSDDETPLISVEVGGASMRICRGADITTVTAIIKALKGAK